MLLYDDNVDYTKILTDYIKETISDGDTVDYTTTYRSPLDICRSFKDEELSTITKHLSIIDCFSPHYSFDDKVVKFSKQEFSQKGFKFLMRNHLPMFIQRRMIHGIGLERFVKRKKINTEYHTEQYTIRCLR